MRINAAGKPQEEQPFHREIVQHESGWWVPAQTGGSFERWLKSAEEHIDAACQYVQRFEVAVQAGCHIGAWAALLAGKFGTVHTFEPDAVNRGCAERNLAAMGNVRLHATGLGDTHAELPWSRSLSNSGKHKVDVFGRGKGRSAIEETVVVVTLDSYDLPACDLICLDIEGYELAALRGAEQTVERHRPVILTENLPHAPWHGLPLDGVQTWMRRHGYREAERIDDDVIWVPE